ncbi:transposase [Actinosynnema sp. NPDC050801]|uniref:transposase n=1 Tax=unclassified Actinosynnema TaxID=2637065 RepID=UPI00341134D4
MRRRAIGPRTGRGGCLPVGTELVQAAAEIVRKRIRCAIPDEVRHREKWRLALDMIDELVDRGVPRRPVVADSAYGDDTAFRQGLADRGLTYAPTVPASTGLHPASSAPVAPVYSGTGRAPVRTTYPDKPVTAKTLVTEQGRSAGRLVVWRHGSRKTSGNPTATMRSRFLALRVRPADRNIPAPTTAPCPSAGYWPNGPPVEPRLPTTGSPPRPSTSDCAIWSGPTLYAVLREPSTYSWPGPAPATPADNPSRP